MRLEYEPSSGLEWSDTVSSMASNVKGGAAQVHLEPSLDASSGEPTAGRAEGIIPVRAEGVSPVPCRVVVSAGC